MTAARARLARLTEGLAVAALLSLSFFRGLAGVPFHQDESLWICCSLYLEAAVDDAFVPPAWFREHVLGQGPATDAAARAWDPARTWHGHYFALDQPPVARYLIGAGRRLAGFGPAQLNRPWRYDLAADENVRLGNMPAPALLVAARRPSALLAVGAGLLLWALVRESAGSAAGLLFALLYSFSGYLLVHLRRAMGDPALLFFAALSAFAAARALAAARSTGGASRAKALRALGWLGASGAAAGLAGASKLNGIALGGVGVVAAVLGASALDASAVRRAALAALGALLATGACAATFVAVNPSLHSGPVAHLEAMVELRGRELAGNRQDPRWGLAEPGRRVVVVLGRTLKSYTVTKVASLNALLGLAGALALARAARRRPADRAAAAATALLSAGLFAAGPALLTPVDWDRYYLFPVVFLTVLIAVGAAAAGGALARFAKARLSAA